MFDSHNQLVVPIRIIGGGSYGTVYKARRYSADVSRRVLRTLLGEAGEGELSNLQQQGQGGGDDTFDGLKGVASVDSGGSSGTLNFKPPTNPRDTMGPASMRRGTIAGAGGGGGPSASPAGTATKGEGTAISPLSPSASPLGPSSQAPLPPPLSSSVASPPTPPFVLVAVKEVSFELIPDDMDDILKEVCFMYGMRHEHIIGYLGSFIHGGTYGGGVPSLPATNAKGPGKRTSQQQSTAAAAARPLSKGTSTIPPSQGGRAPPPPPVAPSRSGGAPQQSRHSAVLRSPAEMEALAQRAIAELRALGVIPPQVAAGAPSCSSFYSGEDPDALSGATEAFSPLPSMCVVEELAADGMALSELIRIRSHSGHQDNLAHSPPSPAEAGGGGGQLPADALAVILKHILSALDYMHTEARVVHRDIKCANVAIDGAWGVAKVLDFGTCGAIDNPKVTRHTMLGTPGWIAPEVLEGAIVTTAEGMGARLGYGFRSDLWSFGVTILELVFLRHATAAQSDPFFARAIKFLSQVQCSASAEMRAAAAAADAAEADPNSSHDGKAPKRPSAVAYRDGAPMSCFIIPPPSAATPFNLQGEGALFTPLLQDLVACCLRRNPSLRPSAAELLRHPYFERTLASVSDERGVVKALCASARATQQRLSTAAAAAAGGASPAKGGGGGGAVTDSVSFQRPMLSYPQQGGSSRAVGVGRPPTADGAPAVPPPPPSALRVPYPMQFLDVFDKTYSETSSLARLNEKGAAASMSVLKTVLAPAARSAPAMAMEIQKRFKTAIAMQSGVPLATVLPTEANANAAAAAAAGTNGPILPPEAQAELQQLALGYHAEDPERHRRATLLMEQHVELLYALESRLPGFAEKFTAKFVEALVTEHPDGGDVLANAVQMLARLKSDVLKPDILPMDPSSNTIEATADKLKEQRPPNLIRMLPAPGLSTAGASSGADSASAQPQSQQHIDPTAFLFNQMLDHYATSGAAGGVGAAGGGVYQQSASRLAGM